MTEFLTVLTLTYFCNSVAEQRMLSLAEAHACSTAYETVKRHFYLGFEVAPLGTPERVAQNATAYAGFKAWEADNPDLVGRLKADAARAAGKGALAVDAR